MGNTSPIVMASMGAATSALAGIWSLHQSNVTKSSVTSLKQDLINAENSRQEIINPYSGITDLSGSLKDLSSMITNPYSKLRVATKAADMQVEEADIALANTLDTIRSTGSSAGGATALAQAALKSKQGVSASIEAQESANEKLKAQGEMQMQRAKMAEAQRLQQGKMSEAQRLQQADVAGKQFMFGQQESRDIQKLNRLQAQIDQQQDLQYNYQASAFGAFGDIASGLMGVVGNIWDTDTSNSSDDTMDEQTEDEALDQMIDDIYG